jgi:hypothetical protein
MGVGLLIFKVMSISICLYLIVLAILTARRVILTAREEIKSLLAELAEEIEKKIEEKRKEKQDA